MAGPQDHPLRNILLTPIDLGTVIKRKGAPPAPTGPGASLKPKGRPPLPETAPPKGGTRVQMRAFDVAETKLGVDLPDWLEKRLPDHAYVQYDDGRDRIIARGGPSEGKGFIADGLGGRLRVVSEVQLAERSVDNGLGTKLIDETFIPDKTAQEAARAARTYSAGVNRGQNLYGAKVNSNSFAGGAHEQSAGRRAGTAEMWGHETRLGDGQLPPDFQRSRRLLGPGLGSTGLGRAITAVAEDIGDRLGGRSFRFDY